MPAWPLPPGAPRIYPSTPGGLTAPSLEGLQFHYNGLTFGAGTDIGVANVSGLGGLPTVNSLDQAFPRDTGEYVGVDAMGGRDPAIDFVIQANIFTQMVSLGGVFFAGGGQEEPLWFQLPGLPTLCSMVRPRDRTGVWDVLTAAGKMWAPSVTFHATDPRLYEQAQALSCAGSGGGTSVAMTVTNAGNVEVRPVLVLTGPLHAPTITDMSIGPPYPAVTFATGTTIATGDQVVVDMSTPHTVTYWTGGVASGSASSIYGWIDQSATSWWTVRPNANDLVCSVSSGSISAGQFKVWWANAYML